MAIKSLKFHVHLILLMGLIAACSSDKEPVNPKKLPPIAPHIFNLNTVFTPQENFINFPYWFNDSLIAAHGIDSLKRDIFPTQLGDELGEQNKNPRKTLTYHFHRNGQIRAVRIETFYEYRRISAYTVFFKSEPSSYFQQITVEPADESDLPYTLVEPSKKTNAFSFFRNSSFQLFFISDSAYWKPTQVELHCKPQEQDWIIWGTPERPVKKYRVEQIVHEKEITNYTYSRNFIARMEIDDFPFKTQRQFRFRNDHCVGFIDSTYTFEELNQITESSFRVNKQKLPIELLQVKRLVSNAQQVSVNHETYTYYFSKP